MAGEWLGLLGLIGQYDIARRMMGEKKSERSLKEKEFIYRTTPWTSGEGKQEQPAQAETAVPTPAPAGYVNPMEMPLTSKLGYDAPTAGLPYTPPMPAAPAPARVAAPAMTGGGGVGSWMENLSPEQWQAVINRDTALSPERVAQTQTIGNIVVSTIDAAKQGHTDDVDLLMEIARQAGPVAYAEYLRSMLPDLVAAYEKTTDTRTKAFIEMAIGQIQAESLEGLSPRDIGMAQAQNATLRKEPLPDLKPTAPPAAGLGGGQPTTYTRTPTEQAQGSWLRQAAASNPELAQLVAGYEPGTPGQLGASLPALLAAVEQRFPEVAAKMRAELGLPTSTPPVASAGSPVTKVPIGQNQGVSPISAMDRLMGLGVTSKLPTTEESIANYFKWKAAMGQ